MLHIHPSPHGVALSWELKYLALAHSELTAWAQPALIGHVAHAHSL